VPPPRLPQMLWRRPVPLRKHHRPTQHRHPWERRRPLRHRRLLRPHHWRLVSQRRTRLLPQLLRLLVAPRHNRLERRRHCWTARFRRRPGWKRRRLPPTARLSSCRTRSPLLLHPNWRPPLRVARYPRRKEPSHRKASHSRHLQPGSQRRPGRCRRRPGPLHRQRQRQTVNRFRSPRESALLRHLPDRKSAPAGVPTLPGPCPAQHLRLPPPPVPSRWMVRSRPWTFRALLPSRCRSVTIRPERRRRQQTGSERRHRGPAKAISRRRRLGWPWVARPISRPVPQQRRPVRRPRRFPTAREWCRSRGRSLTMPRHRPCRRRRVPPLTAKGRRARTSCLAMHRLRYRRQARHRRRKVPECRHRRHKVPDCQPRRSRVPQRPPRPATCRCPKGWRPPGPCLVLRRQDNRRQSAITARKQRASRQHPPRRPPLPVTAMTGRLCERKGRLQRRRQRPHPPPVARRQWRRRARPVPGSVTFPGPRRSRPANSRATCSAGPMRRRGPNPGKCRCRPAWPCHRWAKARLPPVTKRPTWANRHQPWVSPPCPDRRRQSRVASRRSWAKRHRRLGNRRHQLACRCLQLVGSSRRRAGFLIRATHLSLQPWARRHLSARLSLPGRTCLPPWDKPCRHLVRRRQEPVRQCLRQG
jgi:hypothetical protein